MLTLLFVLMTAALLLTSCAKPISPPTPASPPTTAPSTTPAKPASFKTTNLIITPAIVTSGSKVSIQVTVTNLGELSGSYDVNLKIDDTVEGTENITLEGGASQNVTFFVSKSVAKTYTVDVRELSGTFVVQSLPLAPVTIPALTPAQQHNEDGNTLYAQGKYDEAIVEYTKAIELDPTYDAVYGNRATAYNQKGQRDLAIADYNKSIELKPMYVITYINRGVTYELKGQLDLAIADYSKAIDLDRKFALSYYKRGDAYRQMGQKDLAIADLNMCISLSQDPNLTQAAKRNLASIYASHPFLRYDGNDYLSNATADFRSADSSGAIEVWFRGTNSANYQALFSSSDTGTDTSYLFVYINAGAKDIVVATRNAAGTYNAREAPNKNVVDGNWHHIVVSSSGTAWTIIIDGVNETLASAGGSNTGDWFGDITLRDNISIGARINTGLGNYEIGEQGFTRVYSREILAEEALTNYTAGRNASASNATGLVFNLPTNEGGGNPVDTIGSLIMTRTNTVWQNND